MSENPGAGFQCADKLLLAGKLDWGRLRKCFIWPGFISTSVWSNFRHELFSERSVTKNSQTEAQCAFGLQAPVSDPQLRLLCVCVCIYMYACVHAFVCMHVCVLAFICMHVCAHLCICARVCAHICMYAGVCAHLCMCVCMCANVYACVCAHL